MSQPHRQTVIVNLENGLHLVPCSQIAQLARRFDGDVKIRNGSSAVDAKNVLDLMTLRAERGTQLDLEATGAQAEDVIRQLAHLFETDFGGSDNRSS